MIVGFFMTIRHSIWRAAISYMFILSLTASCFASGLSEDLNRYIESGMSDWKIPGLSIAIASNNQIVFERGFGVLEAGKPDKVNADTLFAIGSATKAFTATAIGTLIDQGRLKWDDRVVEHWSEFRLSDPWVTNEIRVSDLLANHSGLSEVAEDIWYGTAYNRRELIERLAEVPITEGFRYQFQYRNVMFLVAGQLIPQVNAGTSWDDHVRNNLFKPLKMDRSTTKLQDVVNDPNLARPHLLDYQHNPLPIAYRDIDNIAPAGSIMSTATDMGNWIRMLTMGGTFEGNTIIKPETLAFIERSQTPVSTVGSDGRPPTPPVELRAYALAWVTESYQGRRIVWHNGSIDGMSAWVGFVPDMKLGVVILSNLDEANFRNALFYHIIDKFSGNSVSDLSGELLEKRNAVLEQRDQAEKQWQALADGSAQCELSPSAYSGKYRNPAFGEVEIAVEDGNLVYDRTPSMVLDLRCQGSNGFLGKFRDKTQDLRDGKLKLEFQVQDGKVTGFSEDTLTFRSVS
jgi:CubicO group peptidase (beta-lactamase class C family)